MKTITLKNDVRIGDAILERGDRIRIKELSNNVADTILSQIKKLDRNALPSWGATKYVFQNRPNNDLEGFNKPNLGYVQFDVKGSKFRGKIIIALMKDDTYSVIAGKLNGVDWKVAKVVPGLHNNQLVKAIDGIVG